MSPEPSPPPEEHRPLVVSRSTVRASTVTNRWSVLVEDDPTAPAIVSDSGTLTRADLDGSAAALARVLQSEAPVADERRTVAVLAPHGSASVVAILSVLQAGFGYLVLDPRWPRARIDACCRAARPLAALVTASTAGDIRSAGVPLVIDIDRVIDDARTSPHVRPNPGPAENADCDPETVAYLLFTSGSTGLPKAVQQSHRGVLVCADNQRAALGLRPTDVLTLLTPFCYDMAAVDLWSALLTGAAVAPYDLATRGLAGLDGFLIRHGVTVFHCAPTVLRTLGLLGGRINGAVRVVLLGGEAAVSRDVETARALFGPDVRIACGYGSTEASFSTMLVLDGDRGPGPAERISSPGSPLPMGPSLPGFTVEVDASGEILVTGRGVALGYLADGTTPGPGAERFSTASGHRRTFRTGDLGERIDGLVYHRGRIDRQIKVRGVRIDPAEVEAILLDVPGVTGVLVGPAPDRAGPGVATGAEHQTLVAHLTVGDAVVLSAADLHRRLSAQLPAAMVPSRFEIVDRLDVTDTGKRVRPPSTGPFPRPRDDDPVDLLVDRVRSTVATVLGIEPSGLDPQAPLMESGAHSLDLVRIHAALSGWSDIELVDLFALGTVAAIARHLDISSGAAHPPEGKAPGSGPSAHPNTAVRTGRRATRVPPGGGR